LGRLEKAYVKFLVVCRIFLQPITFHIWASSWIVNRVPLCLDNLSLGTLGNIMRAKRYQTSFVPHLGTERVSKVALSKIPVTEILKLLWYRWSATSRWSSKRVVGGVPSW
jgi:hypothetical protein